MKKINLALLAIFTLPASSVFAQTASVPNPNTSSCLAKVEKTQKIQTDKMFHASELAIQLKEISLSHSVENLNSNTEFRKSQIRRNAEFQVKQIQTQANFNISEVKSSSLNNNIDPSQQINAIQKATQNKINAVHKQAELDSSNVSAKNLIEIENVRKQLIVEFDKIRADARLKGESIIKLASEMRKSCFAPIPGTTNTPSATTVPGTAASLVKPAVTTPSATTVSGTAVSTVKPVVTTPAGTVSSSVPAVVKPVSNSAVISSGSSGVSTSSQVTPNATTANGVNGGVPTANISYSDSIKNYEVMPTGLNNMEQSLWLANQAKYRASLTSTGILK